MKEVVEILVEVSLIDYTTRGDGTTPMPGLSITLQIYIMQACDSADALTVPEGDFNIFDTSNIIVLKSFEANDIVEDWGDSIDWFVTK